MPNRGRGATADVGVRIISLALDVLLLLLTAAVVFVLVTGGATFTVRGSAVRMHSVDNPIWGLIVILLLRFTLRTEPFLAVPRWRVLDIGDRGLETADAIARRLSAATRADTIRWLPALAIAALAVKVSSAWCFPGFFSGDDVEIHEMTFSALFGFNWPIWNLRNALFPMVFVYPAQRLALAAGITSPERLVFAGRLVVAVSSTLLIPLTWFAARRLSRNSSAVAIVAATFVTVNKLHLSFGSSELPRPVSSALVVGALCALIRPVPQVGLTGALLGIATAFRFSEGVFIVPAVLQLMGPGRRGRAITLVVAWAFTASAVLAMTDWLYWGTPFFSVAHAVDYTLVNRLSSRGYEPLWQYLVLVPTWTNWTFFLLAALGTWQCRTLGLWTWTPIVLLSCLPHKEPRYLIPVVPFVSIAAAFGVRQLLRYARTALGSTTGEMARALLLPLLALALIQDVAGWRLKRSNEGVRLARYISAKGSEGLAVEQPWRMGGRPYLSAHVPLVEIDEERLKDSSTRLDAFKDVRWIAVDTRTAPRLNRDELRSQGFRQDEGWSGGDYVLFSRDSGK